MATSDQKIVEALETLGMMEMECPVCMEVIQSPVFQCHNGHIICSGCLERISLCPTCRSKMPSPRIRNLLAESLAIQKCPNVELGCQVRVTSKNRKQHVLNCEFRSWDICHRIELENAGIKCNKWIKKTDISSHMKNEHNFTVVESNEAVISQEIDSEMEKITRIWLPTTLSAFNNHFFLNTKLIAGGNGLGATVYWKCICAESVEIANGFSVELTLFNAHDTLSLKWNGSVASVDDINGNDDSNGVLSIPLSMVRQFSQRVNGLEWSTKIIIKQTPTDTSNQMARRSVNALKTVSVASLHQQKVSMASASSIETNDIEYKLAYKHILGKYQLLTNADSTNPWNEMIYSLNGKIWTKKLIRLSNFETLEQTFNLGEEYMYKSKNEIRKVIVFIAGNMLIRKDNIKSLSGTFIGEGFLIQEFKENDMVQTWIYKGKTSISIYKKVRK